jgi:hypothetical protein
MPCFISLKEECRKGQINAMEAPSGGRRTKASEARAAIVCRVTTEFGLPAAEIARHLGVAAAFPVYGWKRGLPLDGNGHLAGVLMINRCSGVNEGEGSAKSSFSFRAFLLQPAKVGYLVMPVPVGRWPTDVNISRASR